MILGILVMSLCTASLVDAQTQNSGNVKYRYKQYEKFDLDDLEIGPGPSRLGGIDITNRFRNVFKNKLPERINFNPELIRAVRSIK